MENTYGIHQNHWKRLIKDNHPDDYGYWYIYGEDPNCDVGGPHHEPLLARVEGTFEEAVMYAFTHPEFVQWGVGGRIEQVLPEKFIKLSGLKERLEKKRILEDHVKNLKRQIEDLGV